MVNRNLSHTSKRTCEASDGFPATRIVFHGAASRQTHCKFILFCLKSYVCMLLAKMWLHVLHHAFAIRRRIVTSVLMLSSLQFCCGTFFVGSQYFGCIPCTTLPGGLRSRQVLEQKQFACSFATCGFRQSSALVLMLCGNLVCCLLGWCVVHLPELIRGVFLRDMD